MSLNPAPGLNLTEFVPEILRGRPNKSLSARQIADLVKEARPEAWRQNRNVPVTLTPRLAIKLSLKLDPTVTTCNDGFLNSLGLRSHTDKEYDASSPGS